MRRTGTLVESEVIVSSSPDEQVYNPLIMTSSMPIFSANLKTKFLRKVKYYC